VPVYFSKVDVAMSDSERKRNPSVILAKAGRPRSRRAPLAVAEWVSIIQLLTIAIAGGWTYYVFSRYEAPEKE
jgi:hypothetical protein